MTGGDFLDTLLIDRLIEVLNKETAMYEGILKLSKSKTNVIVEGKVFELESITKLEQNIILSLGKLEREREELVNKLAVQLNLKPSDITLDSLIKLLPEEQAQKLDNCYNALPKVVRDLSDANVLNSKLIRSSLDYIDFSINILTNAGSSGNNYENAGRSSNTRKKNFFDVRL